MFGKEKCPRCKEKLKDSFSFCPSCGGDLRNPEKDRKDFGMLGKNNLEGSPMVGGGGLGFGVSDKIIEKLMNNLMKNMPDLVKGLERQMDNLDSNVEQMPNGIKIQFGVPKKQVKKQVKKGITKEQIDRMSGMPRMEAKSSVRRMSDKIVYELKASGIENVEDVFISKLESGYEVKAIGKNKVYVNSLPVNLPLKGYAINDKCLSVEFNVH